MWLLSGRQSVLGHGISGSVTLHQKGGACYVVKTYHTKENYETRKEYQERVLHEYRVLTSLHHPNIVNAINYSISFDGSTVKLYMEAGSGDLRALLRNVLAKSVTPAEVLCLWKQMCSGVDYLHSQNMCHRDLKLENVVMDQQSGLVKIIDFATACSCEELAIGVVGSAHYMAPETASSIKYDGKAADVWSLGIMLYFMCSRKFPWQSAQWNDKGFAAFSKLQKRLGQASEKSGQAMTAVLSDIPPESVALASRLFVVEPTERCSMRDIMSDPWFSLVGCCSQGKCGAEHQIK